MKKKAILFFVLTALLAIALAFSVSAATTVTDDDTDELTLGACTIDGVDSAIIPEPTVGLVYSLDDTTMTAAVSGRGSFTGGDLVFPSSVTYDGKTYSVTEINKKLFQQLTYNIYVPDSITFIAGGGGEGTFGNSTIAKVYIGSGLSGFERETFSGSNGFEEFVCKSKPTYIGIYAFNSNKASSNGMTKMELDLSNVIRFENYAFNGATILSYTQLELSENVEYIGSEAFVSSAVRGSIVIPASCTLSYRSFNGTSLSRVIIKVKKGTTRELPQELFSGASANLTIIFDGPAVVNQNYVFSGNSTSVYMPSYEMIETLVSTASKKVGNERIEKITFYSCEDGKKYSATSAGVITDNGNADTHIFTEEALHFPADCSRYERDAYVCYVCGAENVISEGNVLSKHIFDVTAKAPNCQSQGYTQYYCTVCGILETAHFLPKSEHIATVFSYELKDNAIITVTAKCEYCNEVVSVEDQSLVNKCYIEGYGLFDATMDYVYVNSLGIASPSAANFNSAVIYFPSYAEVDGRIVEVKTVQGFKAKSITGIYIPDTVTRIAGGSGVGCFGDIGTLKNIVVGKGVYELEQEVFCMVNGCSLDEFIFKGTITSMKRLCLSKVSARSADIPYEFNTALEYVGSQVNINGNILREAHLVKGCNLSEKYAFNNTIGLVSVYIEGGDTPETALDIGQEFTSNNSTKNWYVKGYITVSGQAALSGQNDSRIYMQNKEAIVLFTDAMKKYGYADRMNGAVFMDCETETAWYVTDKTEITQHASVVFSHGTGIVLTETDSTCAQAGTTTQACFVCGKTLSTAEKETLEHMYDGGVITKMPTEDESGTIVYTCVYCGEAKVNEIVAISRNHICVTIISYDNGFDNKGEQIIKCSDCDYQESSVLDAIFTVLGYSVSDDKTGITSGYKINREALDYYEKAVGEIEFGFMVADAKQAGANGIVDDSLKLLNTINGCQITISNRTFSYIDVKIMGANTPENQAHDFILSVYVITNIDGQRELSFVQCKQKFSADIVAGDYTLKAININKACSYDE